MEPHRPIAALDRLMSASLHDELAPHALGKVALAVGRLDEAEHGIGAGLQRERAVAPLPRAVGLKLDGARFAEGFLVRCPAGRQRDLPAAGEEGQLTNYSDAARARSALRTGSARPALAGIAAFARRRSRSTAPSAG